MGNSAEKKISSGCFVLENSQGQTVRTFNWDSSKITVIYRLDSRRVETVSSVEELEKNEIPFVILAETTPSELKRKPLEIAHVGRIAYVEKVESFSAAYEMTPERPFEAKQMFGWSAAVQLGLAGLFIIGSTLTGGTKVKESVSNVSIVPQQIVEKMLAEENLPREKAERFQQEAQRQPVPHQKIVVAPSTRKITKNTPVPTHSTSTKHKARLTAKGPRGGGYRGEGNRGYGTNEPNMNQIGALGALNEPRVKGGNGGKGGLNLRAVGMEDGSGAGGKGQGGFGSNGGGGHGLGGLGTGRGSGLSNAMYGKGLVAAPFGDGSPAPGSGGYGTRGKAGGGARGAGYGTTTVVGSWKGTGPKGDGPAGSGVGNGDPNGSPFGLADGDDDDAIVQGGLDKDQINAVILRNMGQITYCYEQGLQKQPSLAGRVAIRFQIGGRGRVDLAGVSHSSVHSAQVESCIVGKLKNWVFPKPQGGVSVAVTYPFNLRRVSQR
jgi:hypothetical protein